MPAVAATNPPVIIAMLAAATSRIRVGSGGVMLPNHAPLVVAEQFALLEAAFPGRIDLGIGRAPGTDPLTRYVLRGGSAESADEAVTKFPEYVDDIRTLMSTEGVELQIGPRRQPLRATPAATLGRRHVAARVVGLLRPARRGEGPALRLRAPLLRRGDRRRARPLPVVVQAVARVPGAAHLPHRQRRRRRDRGGGAPAGAAQRAADDRAAHRRAAAPAAARRGGRGGRDDARAARVRPRHGAVAGSSARPTRPAHSSTSWRRRTASTR